MAFLAGHGFFFTGFPGADDSADDSLSELLSDDTDDPDVDVVELLDLVRGGGGGGGGGGATGTGSAFAVALGFGLLCGTTFAVLFMGLSFGGCELASSLSLLFSGLKILFVFSFFCAADSACLLAAPLAFPPLLAALAGVAFTLGCGFDGLFTGVTVAVALGLAGGLRFGGGLMGISSDSEE